MSSSRLEIQLKTLPSTPGVYQFFDTMGVVIYVGKAKNLRHRVRSYFNKVHDYGKTNVLVKKIHDIAVEQCYDFEFVNKSELKALFASTDAVHQGVFCAVSPLPFATFSIDKIDELESKVVNSSDERSPRLWVLLDRVKDAMNLGTVLRSSCFFGVDKVLLSSSW